MAARMYCFLLLCRQPEESAGKTVDPRNFSELVHREAASTVRKLQDCCFTLSALQG